MTWVRAAERADARPIARVQVAGWRAAYRGIMPDEVLARLSIEERAGRWAHAILTSPGNVLVACTPRAAVIGFAMVGASRDADADPRTGELWALYVAPDAWGTGAGFALWESSRDALRAQGYREVTLWTLEANRRGRAFYERVGLALEPAAVRPFEVDGASLPSVRYRARIESHGAAGTDRVETDRGRDP